MNCEQTLGRLKPVPKISLLRCLVLNVENKAMPSEKKKVSDGICAPCVRLRFVLTKLIIPTRCLAYDAIRVYLKLKKQRFAFQTA